MEIELKETVISATQSQKQAQKLLEEMVVNGGWEVDGKNEAGLTYRRVVEGQVEVLLLRKDGDRIWKVLKEVI